MLVMDCWAGTYQHKTRIVKWKPFVCAVLYNKLIAVTHTRGIVQIYENLNPQTQTVKSIDKSIEQFWQN